VKIKVLDQDKGDATMMSNELLTIYNI